MKTAIIKIGTTAFLSLAAYWLIRSHLYQYHNTSNFTIQDIIKAVYKRISTEQNMSLLHQMCEMESQDNKISEPYHYTLSTGGKKIRLIMTTIVADMFINEKDIPKEVILVGGLIEYLHSASLIIDDIEDGSLQRRSKPCAHLVYGLDRSINAANLMYFLPFRNLLKLIQNQTKKSQLLMIFVEQMTLSHMGQAQDILVHKIKNSGQLPTLEQYQLLTIAKTSSLLRMMVKMLCILLNRSEEQSAILCQVMNYVGLAFQVTDDVLNLSKNLGKGQIAEDLRQKKFTPIIYFLRKNEQFISLFIQDDKDHQKIARMLEIISESDTFTKTKELAQKYQKKAQDLIQKMKTTNSKESFSKLMKFIITRQN